MKLSVVIVNYNVEYFLEQCLLSVKRAMKGIEGEVFVVDNNSLDNSVTMVRRKFPEVHLIENKANVGFSRANNQAIKKAKGEYILLLNPDTVVEDDTFKKVIDFMDTHPEAGGLGVKMVDGSGNFLPESKRGLPTPATAFYKMFGLSSLFPRSKVFSKYHLGYLDNDKIHEVDVLAGAFMLLRKSVLDITGLLDESFFMYGEDIDLSYRITQAGYKNYYFPETRIIHYKGESTKKSSVNYVLVFYNAMVIFAKKHFTGKNARMLTLLINLAIYFRAFLAILSRLFQRLFLPLLDTLAMLAGVIIIKEFWERKFIYPEGGNYPEMFVKYILPSYLIIWILSIFFAGGYDRPVKIKKALAGILSGTVIILVLYALLPESLRYSRAQILLDTLWGMISISLIRKLLSALKIHGYEPGDRENKRFLIIGEKDEGNRVAGILKKSVLKPEFIGLVSPGEKATRDDGFIGNITQVKDIITIFSIDEVIFCSKNISHQDIIDKMSEWQTGNVDYKIAPQDSLSIIGSNSINTRGDLYTVNINAVDKPANRRNKRLIDIFLSLLFIPLYPVLIFIVKNPAGLLKNIFRVLLGFRSWVGYYPLTQDTLHLPKIKPGILTPLDGMRQQTGDKEIITRLNLLYARDYTVFKDLNIIFYAFRKSGRQHINLKNE